ncbi:DNA-binding protein [Candidatus Bathyarchaeota archaeon]|nr:MAG: DNA-binding protein [Candidatus Bathyarchaeota archaeon]
MVKIILDSNFLLVPLQFRVDIFEELNVLLGKAEPIVLSTTIEELKKLIEKSSIKERMQFSAALKLAERCEILKVKRDKSENYDDVIFRVAKELKIPVATNDSELRKRLREAGIATVYLRQKARLEIDGHV